MMLLEKLQINKKFKILNIDHVAVATENIEILKFIFVDILSLNSSKKEFVKDENVTVQKFFVDDTNTAIELLESKEPNSPINKYINKKGKGIHHIALTVDNIENAIKYLTAKGISLVYDKPKLGSDNKLITFIHPKSSPGILIELCQKV